jgi:hypothetical protein
METRVQGTLSARGEAYLTWAAPREWTGLKRSTTAAVNPCPTTILFHLQKLNAYPADRGSRLAFGRSKVSAEHPQLFPFCASKSSPFFFETVFHKAVLLSRMATSMLPNQSINHDRVERQVTSCNLCHLRSTGNSVRCLMILGSRTTETHIA